MPWAMILLMLVDDKCKSEVMHLRNERRQTLYNMSEENPDRAKVQDRLSVEL
jgi:hypothetical protein